MEYISVSDITKLQLHIYILGYFPMGESVLCVIWDEKDHIVHKSLLIDCFEHDHINQMTDVLNNYNINDRKLDFVIWTHPDLDHSVGFSNIVDRYCSRNTICLMPDGINRNLFSHPYKEVFRSWFSFTRAKILKHNIERVNSSNKRKYPTTYSGINFSDGYNDDLEFDLEILTPFASHSFSKLEINKHHKGNDISISLILRFGNQKYYFGGDSENDAIKMIEPQKLNNIFFVKIPHHASRTSTILPKVLESIKNDGMMEEAISVSTSFKTGNANLPDNNVLDLYKTFSSKILLTEGCPHVNNYGIWKIIYGVQPLKIEAQEAYGDASQYFAR